MLGKRGDWTDLGEGLQRQPDTAICRLPPNTVIFCIALRPHARQQDHMPLNFTRSGRNKGLNSDLMVELGGASRALQPAQLVLLRGYPVRRVVVLGKLVNA